MWPGLERRRRGGCQSTWEAGLTETAGPCVIFIFWRKARWKAENRPMAPEEFRSSNDQRDVRFPFPFLSPTFSVTLDILPRKRVPHSSSRPTLAYAFSVGGAFSRLIPVAQIHLHCG